MTAVEGSDAKLPMQLYGFFRCGTSRRPRVALALKGVPCDYKAVDPRQHHIGSSHWTPAMQTA
jgi:glutathione S-transferase